MSTRRRGLAMLELTLALPILLFIMALIINYGTIAAWKVREHSVARLAVWETRWPRTGPPIPARVTGPPRHRWNLPTRARWQPWTTAASICRWRAVRCPRRTSIPTCSIRPADCARARRSLTRKYPLLGKMGTYTIEAQTWLIDDKWQYQRMGMGDNCQRRIPVLYALAEAPASLVNAYVQSVMAII